MSHMGGDMAEIECPLGRLKGRRCAVIPTLSQSLSPDIPFAKQ